MWLSRKFPIIWCESLIDWHFFYWNNLIESQKYSSQMILDTFRKTLSSCALNGWEEPNLVYIIYKHVRANLWKATPVFVFIAELFSFHVKVANAAITCSRMQFSGWPPIVFCMWLCALWWTNRIWSVSNTADEIAQQHLCSTCCYSGVYSELNAEHCNTCLMLNTAATVWRDLYKALLVLKTLPLCKEQSISAFMHPEQDN